MHIISGKYRGKKLKGFEVDGTRPTMDRVKESLFGMIQSYVVTVGFWIYLQEVEL